MYGLIGGESLEKSCRLGCTAASFALEAQGTQNHKFTLATFNERLYANYGESIL